MQVNARLYSLFVNLPNFSGNNSGEPEIVSPLVVHKISLPVLDKNDEIPWQPPLLFGTFNPFGN
jgi:hypothetical protein